MGRTLNQSEVMPRLDPRAPLVFDTRELRRQPGSMQEYTRQVEGEEDLRVGEVLEVKDGRIIASRVYHG